MIDTLFYFVDTEQEYRRQMQGEDGLPGISPTTIVFVGDSREIYVNGKGYGKTSTNGLLASSEFDQWKGQLNERIDNVISNAASENEEARQKAEEDLEAAMTLVQSMMDTSAEEMADTIQSVRNQIQQAKTELQENIDSANENADEILSALTTFLGTIRNELETSIRDAITNANGRTIWSELNTTNEGITAMTNRIDQSLNPDGSIKETTALQAIIRNGVENNLAVTDIQSKWAVLDENQDVIEWVASGFKSQAHNEGGLAAVFATAQNNTQNAISAMKTEIEQDVAGNYVASADLGTSVIGIVEDELQVESLSALAMKSDVNSATTTITNRLNTIDTTTGNLLTSLSLVSSVAEEGKARASLLTSVGENGTYLVNESSLDGAMSNILTKSGSGSATLIHQMAKEDIAAADISSQIDEATSVLATKVSVEQVQNALTGEIENRKTAVAGLQAQITGEDGLTSTLAGVEARVTDNEASLTSLAQWKDDTLTWKAGVVQTANLDGAVAGLIADGTKESGKKVKASVIATVNDDTSAIKLNADHVFVDANKTTTIGSHYDNAYNPAKNGVNTSIATLKTNTDNDRATLTAISTWKDNKGYVADAGLVTDANKDGAMAALFAENSNSNTKAAVAAIVDDGLSTVTLTADRVFIGGQLNVNIQSYYDGEIENIGRNIDTLEGSIATNATSIAAIDTKAEKNKSDISALTTWKNNTESWKSGVQTTAGLGGAVASLFAENANTDAKANVTAMVDNELSTLTLSADKVYIDGQQGVNIKSYFDSGLNTATNNLSTSIAAVDTKAEANKSSISSLTTWKNNTESWKAGVQTSAGLDGAVAALFAENANTSAKAGVEAVVDGKSSTLTLTADQIKLDAQRTLANTIEATLGHIGGMNIANSSLSSSNGNFSVSSAGKLVAKDAEITGAITATSLSLGSNKISTSNISGLSTVATSGKYTDLSGKPSIPTKISDLNDDVTILKASDVSVSTAASSNGVTTKTITVGGKTYTSITDGDFVLTNIGYGNKSNTYASISSNGLLEARNAIIYGTVYANAGQVAGFTIEEPTNAAANIHYGVTSMSDTSHDGVYVGTNGIRLGKGKFSVSDKGALTATEATITGTINATALNLVGSTKIQPSQINATIPTKLSQLTNDKNFIDNTALSGYALAANVPTSISQLTGSAGILYQDNISTEEKTVNGVKVKTITVGNKSYTTISDNNGFIYTNVGYGTLNANHTSSYFQVSTEGLLTANNAVIYGTVYATNGSFSGKVESTTGHIGGFEIGSTNIHNGVTAMNDSAHDGVYVGTDGIRLGKGKFSVSNTGALTATGANITGAITATSLTLSGTTLPAASVSGLSTIATSGKWSDISGKPAFSAVATSGNYADLSGKPTIPTVPANIITAADVSISETTSANGVTTQTITVGGKQYTSIVSGNFVKTNIGLGDAENTYTMISSDGLLTAKNALIYGTIYATAGQIGGINISDNSISSTNGKFSLSSTGALTATSAAIKGSIETDSGKIGGFTIGSSSISNGLTAMNDSQHNGVYIGTDGIKLGSNDLFSVTKQGILTAKNANITGTINATTLNLGSTVTMPKGDGTTETVSVNNLRNDKLPTVAQTGKFADLSDYATAVPSIAKTGKYSDLKDYDTAVPTIAKTGKLAEASDYSSLPAIAKIGGGKLSDLSGYSNFPAYLKNLRLPTKSEIGVTKLSDLTDDINVVKSSEVTVTTTTNADGLTENTISVGGKTFKSIVGEGFVRTNIGLGNTNNTYVEISSDGLLTAKNAVIYGTIYATRGQIGGINISDNGIASSNGNFSLTSTGQLTATGAAISGTITATDGTIGGYTIDSDKLSVSADRGGTASSLLGFSYSDLTINKNTSYKDLKGSPYTTPTTLLSLLIQSPEGYFPSILAVQRNVSLMDGLGGAIDPITGLTIDAGPTLLSTTKNIVQFSPIGFRTAVDKVVKEYPDGHPEQITTKSQTFTETNRIDTNGAGMLGREGIKWTSAGAFTVSSGFAKSVFDSMSDGFSRTTSTGAGTGKVTTKKTVTPTYDSIKLQKEVTTASTGTTTTTAMEILPDAIKVTKNGTTSTGVTQSFKVSAKGYLNGSWQTYDLTLKFTNGILTGYDKNGFPGSTI